MKHLVAIFLSLFSLVSIAQADMVLGTFKGTDAVSGTPCAIEVVNKYYANNTPHPLNERLAVQFEGAAWQLGHRVVISEANGQVRFDHSYFEQVQATNVGAKTLILSIDHDNEPHASKRFTFIDDNYRDASKSRKVVCEGLSL